MSIISVESIHNRCNHFNVQVIEHKEHTEYYCPECHWSWCEKMSADIDETGHFRMYLDTFNIYHTHIEEE